GHSAGRPRRHRGRPAMVAGFLAATLFGGVGLASAATGQLPQQAQAWAHDVLANVGVSIPSAGAPIDEARGADSNPRRYRTAAGARPDDQHASCTPRAGHGLAPGTGGCDGAPPEPGLVPTPAEALDTAPSEFGVAPSAGGSPTRVPADKAVGDDSPAVAPEPAQSAPLSRLHPPSTSPETARDQAPEPPAPDTPTPPASPQVDTMPPLPDAARIAPAPEPDPAWPDGDVS
ncbi:MAG: hypothetical protein ABIS21_00925, partial [Acidimicrobiales bacterium]